MKSLNTLALLTGALLGVVFIACLLLSWNISLQAMVQFHKVYAYTPVIFVATLGAAIWIERKHGWTIDWRQIIRFAFLSYLVYELFYATGNYLLFDVVDPEAYIRMVDSLNKEEIARLEAAGAPAERIQEVQKLRLAAIEPVTWVQRMVSIGQNLILHFFKACLIGFIIKQVKKQ